MSVPRSGAPYKVSREKAEPIRAEVPPPGLLIRVPSTARPGRPFRPRDPEYAAPIQMGRSALGRALLAALAASSACASPAALVSRVPGEAAALAQPRTDLVGWMLAPEAPAGGDVRIGPDNSRAFLLRGTRWVDHADGSTERSRQVFEEDDVKALELPAHLGGGFLFHVVSGSATLLWRSETWTGDARPLARVEPPVSEIIPGFDRLYLESATTYALRAIDAQTGQAVDLSPLPPAPAYGDMLFADAWTAVVLGGVRGALATFDAGESWHQVRTPAPVGELGRLPDGSILLQSERGRFALGPRGQLAPLRAGSGDAAFRGSNTFSNYGADVFAGAAPAGAGRADGPSSLGPRPLRAAVLSGWPDTPGSAVVIAHGTLGRVRLSDGKLLSAQPFAGQEPCRGVALGDGFGFVCGDQRGDTEVYAWRGAGVERVLRLDGPHAVRSSGNGALVMSVGCDAASAGGGERSPGPEPAQRPAPSEGVERYCVRQRSGALFDVRVRGDAGAERVAALADGRVAVIVPPRGNSPGRLSLIAPSGTTSTDLDLDAQSGPGVRLVRSGLWLDELWEPSSGELGAWVVGARAFVGVRIDLDGSVRIGRVQEGVEDTSFHGPRALSVVGAATTRESTDFGFEWRVSALPPAVLGAAGGARARWPLRGCASVGCIYDDWVRVGWSGERGEPEPTRPPPPERVSFGGSRFAFWTLSCDLTQADGEASVVRAPPASSETRAVGVPESSAWLAFERTPPPERRAGEVGYDFGAINDGGAYRAYAWGPGSDGWARRGVWQVRVGSRFADERPWSTAVTRSPWADPAAAAQAFGLDASVGVDWWFRPSPSEQLGVLTLRVRSENRVHLVQRDRAIVSLDLSRVPDMGVVTGVQPLGDRWYLGATRAEQFHLYRIDGDEPVLVASYPLLGRVSAQLVGSVQQDELGIFARSSGSGWQVYPIDLDSFDAEPPVHVPLEALGGVPPACEPGRPGWLIAAGVPLTDASVSESNTHLDFTGSAAGLRTKRLTARVVLDEAGLCVDALAALVEGTAPRGVRVEPRERRPGALPLTVTDPVDERRWSFRCSP